jgi:hypothetical protein
VREDGVDLGHDVLAIDEDGAVGAVAQRDVEDGAVLGDVDLLAGEHLFGPAGTSRSTASARSSSASRR